jgi:hypothetical protein
MAWICCATKNRIDPIFVCRAVRHLTCMSDYVNTPLSRRTRASSFIQKLKLASLWMLLKSAWLQHYFSDFLLSMKSFKILLQSNQTILVAGAKILWFHWKKLKSSFQCRWKLLLTFALARCYWIFTEPRALLGWGCWATILTLAIKCVENLKVYLHETRFRAGRRPAQFRINTHLVAWCCTPPSDKETLLRVNGP